MCGTVLNAGANNRFLSSRWLMLFCTFGYASSFGVFQDYYATVSTSTSSQISWIGSVQVCS